MSEPIKILFVCVANSCRSQMAEAIARKLDSEKQFVIDSAGGMPAGVIDSGAREFLQVRGFDLTPHRSKGFSDVLPLVEYDAVVTLCAEACVALPPIPRTTRVYEWNLADPTGSVGAERQSAYDHTYKTLEEKISALFDELRSGAADRDHP